MLKLAGDILVHFIQIPLSLEEGGGGVGGGGRWESAVTRNFCLLALLLIYLIYILFNNVIKIYINCILPILGLPKVIINFSQ